MKNPVFLVISITCFITSLRCQEITFSQPLDPDILFYNVICKHDGLLLTYNIVSGAKNGITHQVYMYDDKMNVVKKTVLPLPGNIYGLQFLIYPDFFYIFYQRQQSNIVYLEAAKIGMDGTLLGNIKELDETIAPFTSRSSKIYTILNSENKKQITAFKINNRNWDTAFITILLFDEELSLKHSSELHAPLISDKEFFTEFNVDNDGDFMFIRNFDDDDNATAAGKTVLIIKKALSDSVYFTNIIPADIRVNDIHLKIDNLNKKYILTAFYTIDHKDRRNTDGLYCFVWDKANKLIVTGRKMVLDDSLRKAIHQRGPLKEAFNNFSVQNITLRKDGGFIIDAGCFDVFIPGMNYSVWQQQRYAAKWNQANYYTHRLPGGYIFYVPNSHFPWNDWYGINSRFVNFTGENLAAFSFGPAANTEWTRLLPFSQLHNKSSYIGYTAFNIHNSIHYLFNQIVKKNTSLSAPTLGASGEMDEIMIKDADRIIADRIRFIPRVAVQLNDREVILTCEIREKTCLAKIVFSR